MVDNAANISGWLDQIRMSAKVADSDTPLIRWCVLLIAVMAIWFWVVEPVQIWKQDLRDQISRNSGKAARLVALQENADTWQEAEIRASETMSEVEEGLYVTSSDTVAQAGIQKTLQDLAASRNLVIESQKLLSAELMEPIGYKLPIEVGLRGELVDVLQYLDDVSQANKLLVIDRWIIQMDRNGKAYARFVVAGLRPLGAEEQPSDG